MIIEAPLQASPFNTPLESGVRALSILVAAYPKAFDLQKLVAFDHLVVHTADVGGPESLHPELPMRSAALLIRRSLVERGLLLMVSRGLVNRRATVTGILYEASEFADTFIASLESTYLSLLREKSDWVIEQFAAIEDETFKTIMAKSFGEWVEEFQDVRRSLAGEP